MIHSVRIIIKYFIYFSYFVLDQLSIASEELHPVSLPNGINNHLNSENETIKYEI